MKRNREDEEDAEMKDAAPSSKKAKPTFLDLTELKDFVDELLLEDDTPYYLLSGSDKGEIIMLDLQNDGKVVQQLNAHKGEIFSIITHLHYIISAGCDCDIKVWDIKTGALVKTLTGHIEPVSWLQMVNENLMVSCSFDSTIRLWDLETWTCTKELHGHDSGVAMVHVYANLLASASTDKSVRIWDISTGELLITLRGHENWVSSVAFIDHDTVVSGSCDQTLRIWSLSSKSCKFVCKGHTDWILDVKAFDNQFVYTASSDCTLRKWNIHTGECKAVLTGHTGGIYAIHTFKDKLLTSGYDRCIRVWADDTMQQTLQAHAGILYCLQVVQVNL